MATYIYGVVRADGAAVPQVASVDPDRGPVRPVAHGPVAAFVSDVDEPLRATTRALKAHSQVLEVAVADQTVLPLQFGTVVPDDGAVTDRFLAPRAADLEALLDRFDGHVELDVKVFDDEETVLRDVIASDRAVAALQAKVAGIPPEAAYYDRIRLGERVAQLVGARRAAEADALTEALRPLASDLRVTEPSLDRMVFDGAFLVDRDRVGVFDEAVEKAVADRPDWTVRYLGPMPVYSFAALEG